MREFKSKIEMRSLRLKLRSKRHSTKIDMTPMVDLAFLLLTFFILTTTMMDENTLDIVLPASGTPPKPVNNAVNIILSGEDKLFYYTGELRPETTLKATNFKAIRNVIGMKNKKIIAEINRYIKGHPGVNVYDDSLHVKAIKKIQSNPSGVTVIIKYDSEAKYRNAIDIVDEMDVCGVGSGRYAIVNTLEPLEKSLLMKAKLNYSKQKSVAIKM